MIEIRRWDNQELLFRSERATTIAQALVEAVAAKTDLYRASLDGASLYRARLYRARLDGASLVGASLDGASLDGASLVGASLDGASLVGASLDGASLGKDIDIAALTIPSLHRKMLAAIDSGAVGFCMADWHCGTTHCRAGLCVVLAGAAGAKLESASDTATAGAIITALSSPGVVPDFYASDGDALAAIREAAANEPELAP